MIKMIHWVRHISGQGEKWEVDIEGTKSWRIKLGHPQTPGCSPFYYFFPKSEYIPCDPPEVWEDVTTECNFSNGCLDLRESGVMPGQYIPFMPNYRLRKVLTFKQCGVAGIEQWSFIVERRKP